jgi:hypothetical protein
VSYVVESDASRGRRRRRRRALITLCVVALMLFFAFWYAYSYYRSDDSRHVATPKPSCTTSVPITPKSVKVNVYNATDRNGLAAKTATQVKARGFTIGTVANDPLNRTINKPAQVRYGSAGKDRATLVLALVKGAEPVLDKRTDTTVDLVIGERFTALAPAPKAANAKATTAPKPSATTSKGC